jgi:glyoxylase-like metal-dependent hydrolase (beta-lactamase superfamily II)
MRMRPGSVVIIGLATALASQAWAQPARSDDPCGSMVPAAMGGPMPAKDQPAIVLRWLSTSNFELVYRGQVFLLDAYFDRGPRNRPTGVVPSDVKKADAIFIGHAHFDHISDVGPIARATRGRYSARRSRSRLPTSSASRRDKARRCRAARRCSFPT